MNAIVLISIILSYGFVAWVMVHLGRSGLPLRQRLLLAPVVFCGLGKLLYIPDFLAQPGLKLGFLVLVVCLLLYLLISIRSIGPRVPVLLLAQLLWLIPIILSLFGVDPGINLIYDQLYEEQSDSIIMRAGAGMALITYAIFVAAELRRSLVVRDGFALHLDRIFCSAALFACGIGLLFFVGIYQGILTADDLGPVSADTHVVGRFYRFNPGANVNEFGAICGIAIFLHLFCTWGLGSRPVNRLAIAVFFIAMVLGLTRAVWLAFLVAILFMGGTLPRAVIWLGAISVLIGVGVAAGIWIWPEFGNILIGRLAFDIGPSGADRLDKFTMVITSGNDASWWVVLFGHGWATNLYAHSLLFQLLYEVGIVGSIIALTLWTVPAAICLPRAFLAGEAVDRRMYTLAFSLWLFVTITAMLHHTLYHIQTWIALAVIMALAVKPRAHSRAIKHGVILHAG